MPRRRTLSGRVERQNDAQGQNLRRAYNVNTFKIALNLIPEQFDIFSLSRMNLSCSKCLAVHFESEITSRDRTKFSLCCHKGKVDLWPLRQNQFFNAFFDGLRSNNPSEKRLS